MTFSSPKFRVNNIQTLDQGGAGGLLPAQIPCGTVVDDTVDLDVVLMQDTSGSYGAAGTAFIRQLAPCIITAFPRARIGLAFFSDYGDAFPYGEQVPLGNYTSAETQTWTLPQQGGGDEYEAALDAFYKAAISGSLGWRECAKKVIVLNTDTYPHDRAIEGGSTYVTRAMAAAACQTRNIWPIYVLTSSSYYSQWLSAGKPQQQYTSYPYTASSYSLGYGGYGFGTPNDLNAQNNQILSAIFYGMYQTIPATCAGLSWWSSFPEIPLYKTNPGNFAGSWGSYLTNNGIWVGTPVDANIRVNETNSFVKGFRVPETGNYTLNYSVDNQFDLFIDGNPVTSGSNNYAGVDAVNNYNLTAGDHSFIINLKNLGNASNTSWNDNPGGLAIKVLNANNEVVFNLVEGTEIGLVSLLDPFIKQSYPGSGTIWYDLSYNKRNASLVDATFDSNDKSFNVNASSSQYINLGNYGAMPNTGTISFWFNSQDWVNYRNMFATHFQGGNAGFRFEQYDDKSINLVVGTDGGTYTGYNIIRGGPNSTRQGRWFNIVIAWNKITNRLIVYYNGIKKIDATQIYWPTTFPSMTLGNGFNSGRYFTGKFSTFAMYNRILTDKEIQNRYSILRGRYDESYISYNGLSVYFDASIENSYTNGNKFVADLSGKDNNGLLSSGITYSEDNYGIFNFTGSSNSINVSYNTVTMPSGTQSRTLVSIFNTSNTSNQEIISIGGDGYTGSRTGISLYKGNIAASFNNTRLISNTSFTENTWYHVVLTTPSGGNIGSSSLFINGELVATTIEGSNSAINTQTTSLKVGGIAGSNSESFIGKIQTAMLYNRALTPLEVTRNYTATRSRFDNNGLVLYLDAKNPASYPNTGNIWYDLSGNSKLAGIIGSPTFVDGAFKTNSDSNYISISNEELFFRSNNFTYSTWVNWSAAENRIYTIFENGSWGDTLLFRHETSGFTVHAESAYLGAIGPFAPKLFDWHNVVLRRLGNIVSVHVDGLFFGSLNMTSDINLDNYNMFLMRSQHTGGQYFDGKMSEFSVYNRALSNTEILNNYTIQLPKYKTTNNGLILYLDAANNTSYPGSGSIWYDLSGQNNHATLFNSPTWRANNSGVFEFNGSNQNAKVALPAAYANTTVIVGARYLPGGPYGRVCAGLNNNYLLGFWGNNIDQYYAEGWVTGAGGTVPDTRWRIAVGVSNYRNDNYKFYNGKVLVADNNNGSQSLNGLSLGSWGNNTEYSKCQISFVQVYNRVLSKEEIDAIIDQFSPRINQDWDKLVLHLDAANTMSYPGTGTTVFDLSGYNNHATMTSATFNSANGGTFLFSNKSSYINTPFDLSRYPTGTVARTLVAIISPQAGYQDLSAFGVGGNGGGGTRSNIFLRDNKIMLEHWNGGKIPANNYSQNAWYHVALVSNNYSYASNTQLYINGVLVPTTLAYGDVYVNTQAVDAVLGQLPGAVPNAGYGFLGKIPVAKMWNRALSPTEIEMDYNSYTGRYEFGTKQGLVFNLDAANTSSYSGTGSTWFDISGYGATANLGSFPQFNTSKGNGHISFYSSQNQTAYFTVAPVLDASTITVEMMVRVNALNDAMLFGWSEYDVYTLGGVLSFNTSNGDRYGVPAANVAAANVAGNWKHLVFVMRHDNPYTNNRIYIDGVLQTLSQIGGGENANKRNFNNGYGAISGWRINTSYRNNQDVGVFRIYNGELTQAQITQNYDILKTRYNNTSLVLDLDANNTNSYNASVAANVWFDMSGENNHVFFANSPSTGPYSSANNGLIRFRSANNMWANIANSNTSGFGFGSTPFTMSAWATANSMATTYAWIFGYGNSATSQGRFIGRINNTFWFGGYADDLSAGPIITPNTWFNIVGVYNGTQATMYVNGQRVAGPTTKGWNTNKLVARLGRQINDATNEYWDGNVSKIQLYNRALSETEIIQNFDAVKERYFVDTTNLFLDLDAANTSSYPGSGSTWTDLSGKNNNGTLVNSPTFNSGSGGSIVFNGSNQYVTFPTTGFYYVPINGTLTEFTINTWVYWNAFPTGSIDEIISWWTTGGQIYSDGFLGTSCRSDFVGSGNGTNANPVIRFGDDFAYSNVTFTAATDTGKWWNITAVKTANNAFIYRNGVLAATKGSPLSFGFNSNMFIGRQGNLNGEYLNGRIAKIQLHSRALSGSEISTNFDNLKSTYGL